VTNLALTGWGCYTDGLFLDDCEYEAQAQKSKMECKVGAKRRGFTDGLADPNGGNSPASHSLKRKQAQEGKGCKDWWRRTVL
jgi:hypothetical protein